MRHFKGIRNVGKISILASSYCGCNWYKYKKALNRKPTVRSIKWLENVILGDGSALPASNDLLRLMYHGYVKIEATDKGREFFEREGKVALLIKGLEKL